MAASPRWAVPLLFALLALSFAAGKGPWSVAVGDFNGDLLPDLAVASELKRVAPKNLDVGGFVQRVADLGTSIGIASLITALWPATSYGAGLRRGDRVRLTVRQLSDRYLVVEIKKIQ